MRAQPRPRADAVHLPLDEPVGGALAICPEHLEFDAGRTGVDDEYRVHRRLRGRQRHRPAARIRIKDGGGAGCHPRTHGIRPRRQYDRNPCAEDDPRGIGLGEIDKVLGKHVPGFEIGHHEDLRAARNLGFDALDLCGLGIDGIVEGQRPIEDAAGDLPALRHLAQRRSVDGRRNFRAHRFHRGKYGHARRAKADLGEEVDDILDDVALGIEIGKDVDRGIGDEERLGISRHVHDEDMADPPGGAQPGLARRHLAHEFVGMQAALHQKLALGFADEFDPLYCGGFAVGHVDDLKTVDPEAVFVRNRGNLGGRPHQNRNDDAGFRRLDGPAQRSLVAGMHDDRARGGNLFCPGQQPLVLGRRWRSERPDHRDSPDLAVLVGGHVRFSRAAAFQMHRIRTLLPGVPFEPGERGWGP